MAVSGAQVLHGILNNTTFISQIENNRVSPATDALIAGAAGFHQPLFTAVQGLAPAINFDSTQIGTLLDLGGLTLADLSANNTDLLYKAAAQYSHRQAAAEQVHQRFRIAKACLAVNRVTAGHRQIASANCSIYTRWDGTNQPIVPAGTVAISGTPAASQFYLAGPCAINGTELGAVQSISLDFGHNLMMLGGDGEVFHSFIAQRSVAPVLTISILGSAAWNVYGLAGTALTSVLAFFRRLAADGSRVADGTATHTSIAGAAGLITIDETSNGGNQETVTNIRCHLRATDSASSAVAIDTTAAITFA